MNLNNPNLKKYLTNGYELIEGWVEPELFLTLDVLSGLPINQQGGVCEIGVHYGKFYLMMSQVASADYKSFAIDIFDNQMLNIDGSGEGNLDKFKKNLIDFAPEGGKNTVIIQGDSTDSGLKLDQQIEPGSIRFFSIDGGHTPAHAVNDLQLASKLINNQGIVILDDILNHWWTGVLEGFVQFLSTTPALVPVAIGHNKLYLCKLSYHAYYLNLFKQIELSGPKEVKKFFGYDVVIYRYWPRFMTY